MRLGKRTSSAATVAGIFAGYSFFAFAVSVRTSVMTVHTVMSVSVRTMRTAMPVFFHILLRKHFIQKVYASVAYPFFVIPRMSVMKFSFFNVKLYPIVARNLADYFCKFD